MKAQPTEILIIDENPQFANSLTQLLVDITGLQEQSVCWISNVYDALEALVDGVYRYIFLHVKMSSLDNLWITSSITLQNNSSAQIIALSFHTEDFFRAEVLKAGAHQYLIKDAIDHQVLTDILRL